MTDYTDFSPVVGESVEFYIKMTALMQALNADIGDGGGGGGGGGSPIYAGRHAGSILLTDSATSMGYSFSAFLPDTTLITSDAVNTNDVTLTAGKVYIVTGEAVIINANADMSEAEFALMDKDSYTTGVVCKAVKKLAAGTMNEVRLKLYGVVKPVSNISVGVRLGIKGTGCSIPAQVGANYDAHLKLSINEYTPA